MKFGIAQIINLAIGGVVFYGLMRLLNKFTGTDNSDSDSSNDESEPRKKGRSSLDFEEKRKKGMTGSYGGVRVKGGLLPKSGSIGTVEFLFDGSFPAKRGKSGKADKYVTDGHIQVIYKDKKQAEEVCFQGKTVDVYFK
ncbi:hypothetical protein [Trichlorobacter lovleyi]|uniref:hypothetical protein n=1 Tax=Trichlorobacter lovleyi TaxID=313985 RepID=UPI0023EFD04C|nr:hypothetical protein [Trichlorobacter lovleyi]